MLAEALAEFKKKNEILDTKLCALGAWISSLPEEDQAQANQLMFDDPISNHKIHLFLRTLDVDLSTETIRKHRMKGCACLWTN